MIKPEQIPDEVGYAASKALHSYPELEDFKVAIAAAINAWPGMRYSPALNYKENPVSLALIRQRSRCRWTLPILTDTQTPHDIEIEEKNND